MRIVITGGAGFLGSHLCDFLLSEGHNVLCMDNLITGNIANIQHLRDNKNFEFIEHNVTEYMDVNGQIDYVLHFASPASPIDFLRLPIQILKVGALGALNALGLAKSRKAVFLLASSSEVYGDPLIHPQKEDYTGNVNPIGPRGVYDEAKRFAEALTMAYNRQHGVKTRIVRIFNTYGPRMRRDDGRVIPTFVTQALDSKPLTIFGDGSQTRSFCYVSDLVKGIYKLMLSNIKEPINIGNPQEITINELAHKVIDLTGSRSQVIYKPLPHDDPKLRRPDIGKASSILRWKPEITLDEGLKRTINWLYRE
ncbi:UDP-glucuronic acid decarboxylase family protein [Chloroflexota bacterium]